MGIDLTGVKERSFEPLPEGKYVVQAETAETKTTKDGTGEYIKVKFKVVENGRVLFHNFNTKNKNEMATQIGLEQLKSFMSAAAKANTEVTSLNNVTDLEGMVAKAYVKIRDSDQYGDQNVITYFMRHEEDDVTRPTKKGAPTFDASEKLPF